MTWRRIVLRSSLLAVAIPLFSIGCSGSGSSTPSNPALNLAGTWTVTTTSTQGQGKFSGTATVTQTGQGLGVNGSTTLSAMVGQVAVAQSGTALTGSITNSMKGSTAQFTGTLSGGTLTLTGTAACNGSVTESTSISGTISSTAMQGTYTITRGAKCYAANDAGTFVATKQ